MTVGAGPTARRARCASLLRRLLLIGCVAGLGACTVKVHLAGPRLVDGDLAAASMGLARRDAWLGAVPRPARAAGRPRARDTAAFEAWTEARRAPSARLGPASAEVSLAPDVALATGPVDRPARIGRMRVAAAVMPALGPEPVRRGEALPLPAPRPLPLPSPRKPDRSLLAVAPAGPAIAGADGLVPTSWAARLMGLLADQRASGVRGSMRSSPAT